jgi:hypothetical protein
MIFLKFLEFVVIAFLLFIVVSQIIVPAMMGTRLFPFVRKQGELESKLVDIEQSIKDDELQKKIDEHTKSLNQGESHE